ncbi:MULTISPECIES: universal stress protein [unclassified Spirosoma]|uniref:universal stress protein n=1 Tax=unclassified Spirosoma TaxID=2621999 RepID=UPI0009627DF9|nr:MULTISPECIES: universal stress protein [unclassified Spirosoma]OJW78927.1 MAG: universal stress protein UspA [Spirosoma sp. 48-14]
MNTIVVPCDLSTETDSALSVAVDIARTSGATIQLVHSVVYPLPVPAYAEAATIAVNRTLEECQAIEQAARTTLERLAANETYKGITIVPVLLTNGEGLVHNITEQSADLIVMTSEGATGLEEWLVGSNAEAIVRHAKCPVLIVKEPIAHFQPETIVCGIDIDDRLKVAQHYPFQMGKQGLHQFLYVTTPLDNHVPEGVHDWVSEFARSQNIADFDFAVRQARNIPDGIINYAEEVNADLIVLFTHGYTGLRHLLSGSVAEDVLNHSKKPVLVMRI